MDYTKIKLSNCLITPKKNPGFTYRRAKTENGDDVTFILKDVLTFGISDMTDHQGKVIKRSLPILLWHDVQEPNPSTSTTDTVLAMQGLHTQLCASWQACEEHREGSSFKYYDVERSSVLTEQRMIAQARFVKTHEGPPHCVFYPDIQPEHIPVLDSTGKVVDPEQALKDRARVNVVVRFSGLGMHENAGMVTALLDVVAVEVLGPVAKPMQIIEKLRVSFQEGFLDELNPVLRDCGAWLTGSYLLQIVNGDEASDVDLFCPSKRAATLIGFFFNGGGKIVKMYNADIPDEYKCMSIPIENVIDIELGGKKFQIISLLCEDVEQHILGDFDFSFCKVRWNGEQLLPEDLSDIVRKVGRYDPGVNRFRADRVRKYTERGYTITCDFDGLAAGMRALNLGEPSKAVKDPVADLLSWDSDDEDKN